MHWHSNGGIYIVVTLAIAVYIRRACSSWRADYKGLHGPFQIRDEYPPRGAWVLFRSSSCGGEQPRKNTCHRFFFGLH